MIYLIDYENVNNEGVKGIDKLTQEDKVIFFLKEEDTFKAKTHMMIESSIVQKEYIFFHHSPNTPNALDFQLIAYLALLSAENAELEFRVVSNDKGYDAAICFLIDHGRKIKRVRNLENVIPIMPMIQEIDPPLEDITVDLQKDNLDIFQAIDITEKETESSKKLKKPTLEEKLDPEFIKVKKLLPNTKDKHVKVIVNTIKAYKTKVAIHNNLVKQLGQEKTALIYDKITPLLKNKK